MSTKNYVLIPLKNRDGKHVKLDQHVFDALSVDAYLSKVCFFDYLREHSSGYAVFQRFISDGTQKNHTTIYLHKLIGERFLVKPVAESGRKLFVHFIDGNKLNVLLSNLEYITMGMLRRKTESSNSNTGYRGVVRDGKMFRAIIYQDRKPIHLGKFNTAEEAAAAYDKKSIELFGVTDSLNLKKGKG